MGVKNGKGYMSSNNNHLYKDQWTRLDTLLGEIGFLGQLMRALKDYEQQTRNVDPKDFLVWLHTTYGIIVTVKDGNLTADYSVVDEQKHLLFILKYSI